MGVGAFVARDGIDPFANRTVLLDPVSHELEIVGPLDLMQRREVHQDLTVHTEVEQQADVGLGRALRCSSSGQVVRRRWLRAPIGRVFALAARGSRFSS